MSVNSLTTGYNAQTGLAYGVRNIYKCFAEGDIGRGIIGTKQIINSVQKTASLDNSIFGKAAKKVVNGCSELTKNIDKFDKIAGKALNFNTNILLGANAAIHAVTDYDNLTQGSLVEGTGFVTMRVCERVTDWAMDKVLDVVESKVKNPWAKAGILLASSATKVGVSIASSAAGKQLGSAIYDAIDDNSEQEELTNQVQDIVESQQIFEGKENPFICTDQAYKISTATNSTSEFSNNPFYIE